MNYLRYSLASVAILILGCSGAMAFSDGTVSIIIGSQVQLEEIFGGDDIHIDNPASVFRPEGLTIYEGGTSRMAFGFEVDFGPEDTPVKMLVGTRYTPASDNVIRWRENSIQESVSGIADDDMLDTLAATETSITEVYAGILVRPTGRPKFNPYIGGGITYVSVDSDAVWVSQNPNTPGEQQSSSQERNLAGFVTGGARWRFGEKFQIGVSGRFLLLSSVQMYDFRAKGEVNYFELGAIGSWEW
jgi:opacity protein-like surface antigen